MNNWEIANRRRARDGIAGVAQQAIVGNENGQVHVAGKMGYVYVRYIAGEDENGFARYSPSAIVRSGMGASYLPQLGRRVWVGADYDGELCIKQGDFMDTVSAGISPLTSNPMLPEAKFFPTDLYLPLRSSAISTAVNPVTYVKVNSWLGADEYGGLIIAPATDTPPTGNPDLAPYIPPAQKHRYAMVWLDTFTEQYHVTASTAQSMFTPLDLTDVEELFTDRPADGVPIKAYYLADNQSAILQSAREIDLRQLINVPDAVGYANPVIRHTRIRDGREQITRGVLTVTSASLTIYGTLWAL